MEWTYTPDDLTDPVNRVRLMIGDTNEADKQLYDEEIQTFLDSTSSELGAAGLAARALAGRYARAVDKWVGDLKLLASQRYRHYLDLVENLSGASATIRGMPFAGGIRYSGKQAIEENDDLVVPSFRIGMHDNTSA